MSMKINTLICPALRRMNPSLKVGRVTSANIKIKGRVFSKDGLFLGQLIDGTVMPNCEVIIKKPYQKWTRELVIAILKEKYANGEDLSSGGLRKNNLPLMNAMRFYFGNFKASINAAGLPYKGINKQKIWNKEKVIFKLKEKYANGEHINASTLQKTDTALFWAALRYFGSLESAVEAAGLNYNEISINKTWTKEIIISTLRTRYFNGEGLGFGISTKKFGPNFNTIKNHFGNYRAALEAAGLDPDAIIGYQKWDKDKVINILKKMHLDGESLEIKDIINDHRSLYDAMCRYFGDYNTAFKAAGLNYDKIMKKRGE